MSARNALVVPVYKNEDSVPNLLDALAFLHQSIDEGLHVVLVVDGSPDASYALLEEALPKCSFPSTLVLLSRNFGSFAAIREGLRVIDADQYAVMAADLQEPKELIIDFFQSLSRDECDIAIGKRAKREDPAIGRFLANAYWSIYRRYIQSDMPKGGVDVFGCTRAVRNQLIDMHEQNSSLVGLLVWSGYRRKEIPYTRLERQVGKSAWTFRKKLDYMLNSSFAFSEFPIFLLQVIGILGIVSSLGVSTIVFVAWIRGLIEVKGYTPIILSIFFCTSLILLGLGIVGGYVWRTFENSKGRPSAIVRIQKTFDKEDS